VSAFRDCLAFTWLPQNDGQPYHVTPGDPGGGTAWGVTQHTWAAWAASHDGMPASVGDATQDDLAQLYQAQFWNAVSGDLLPKPVALMVFDFGVVSGPGMARMHLQSAVGVHVDGDIGPATLAAVAAEDVSSMVTQLWLDAGAFYDSLTSEAQFDRGWHSRNDARRELAAALLISQ